MTGKLGRAFLFSPPPLLIFFCFFSCCGWMGGLFHLKQVRGRGELPSQSRASVCGRNIEYIWYVKPRNLRVYVLPSFPLNEHI